MSQISLQELKIAFRGEQRDVISDLYVEIYPLILKFVKANSGNDNDAKDLLQEAMLVLLLKFKQEDFDLDCSFRTYVYSVCKKLWMKQLRSRKRLDVKMIDVSLFMDESVNILFDEESKYIKEYFLFRRHFHSLSQICRDIIELVLKDFSYSEIADKLKLSDSEYVRKKKYRCKENLIKRIKKDPQYIHYTHEYCE